MSRGDLTEVEWRILRVLLPDRREPGERGRGRPPEDNRNLINGILWRLRTGAPWRDVPEKYGNWNSIYRRFRHCIGDARGEPIAFHFTRGEAADCKSYDTLIDLPEQAPDALLADGSRSKNLLSRLSRL